MKTAKQRTILIETEESKVVQVDIDDRLTEFYKHETGHKRVTNRGLAKFFSNLVKLFTN